MFVQTHWEIADSSRGVAGLSEHPRYGDAKRRRDIAAALEIIESVASYDVLDRLIDCFGDPEPVVVAPAAIPEESHNALAVGYAQWLGHELGVDVHEGIFQGRGPRRDRRGKWYRLANEPAFYLAAGEVAGRDFIIADDVFTLGGTMAALRSFIESQGGRVICMTALAHRSGQPVEIALASRTKFGLDRRHGEALDALWREEFGYGTECLTEPEGQLLLAVPFGVDRIREELHGARDA